MKLLLPVPFRIVVHLIAALGLAVGIASATAHGAEQPGAGGILVYKLQPWHKADQALVKEYAKVRRFATVLWVTELGETKERRMTQTLVFAAHDYLPFDATGTTDEPLAALIDKEIAALEDLAARFPVARSRVEPRLAKWREIRAQLPAESAPSPTPDATAVEEVAEEAAPMGKFRNTVLPVGGALGMIRLTSGEEFQAWITALTPTHLKWDEPVKEGSGVYEERVLALRDVQSLQVYTAEDVARSQFKKLEVPKTSLTDTAYEVLYEHYFQLLKKMQTQFGDDPRYSEWHSEIVQIREDMQQAQSTHSLRIDGRWLTREEMQRDAYESSAKVLWASATQMAALSHWKLAIEYCRELQTKYPDSRTFVENVPAMRKWLEAFGRDRTSLRALKENPDVADQVTAVLETLKTFDLDAAQKSLDLSADAAEAIGRGDRTEADRLLKESARAWPRNAEVRVLQQQLQALPAKK